MTWKTLLTQRGAGESNRIEIVIFLASAIEPTIIRRLFKYLKLFQLPPAWLTIQEKLNFSLGTKRLPSDCPRTHFFKNCVLKNKAFSEFSWGTPKFFSASLAIFVFSIQASCELALCRTILIPTKFNSFVYLSRFPVKCFTTKSTRDFFVDHNLPPF